jgi:dihydrolipoamide dehydrogenase
MAGAGSGPEWEESGAMFKKCLIIGGGPAGTAAAAVYASSGLAASVAVVERAELGGTCTHRGCVPTKFLLARGEPQQAPGGPDARAAWTRALNHKAGLVKGLGKSIERDLATRGVEVVRGAATFIGPNAVEVRSPGGEPVVIEAESIIVAAGSEPAQLPSAPFDGSSIISSTDALTLDPLPASLAVVGSGAVGAEFARIFARQGVAVTLLEAAERLFPAEDPDVDPVFRKVYREMGVAVHTGDPVERVDRQPAGGVLLHLRSGAVIGSEKVLVAVGRALNGRTLGCEAAGVRLGARGEVLVDADLRTSVPHIYAAGDVNGRMLLAHAASCMGRLAALRTLGDPVGAVPYGSIPWATFSDPEVASVGVGAEAAARAGLQVTTATAPMMESVKARIERTTAGFIKLVVGQPEGRILGATIVGAHASEMIHCLALAIHQGMTITDLRSFVFLHPSISETIGDLVAK